MAQTGAAENMGHSSADIEIDNFISNIGLDITDMRPYLIPILIYTPVELFIFTMSVSPVMCLAASYLIPPDIYLLL